MAGDWIKMRGNLWDDPRVARIVDMTDSSEATVIGALYWLWSTADQHTEDGTMPGLTLKSIDRKTGVQGFGDALCVIGWIADHPEGIRIVDFEKHNGTSAKKRLETAKRVASHRKKDAPKLESNHVGNEDVTHKVLPNANKDVTGALAREEKRREEKSNTNTERTAKQPTARGSRLPQNFIPDLSFAKQTCVQDATEEFARFKDYWIAQPGQKGVKTDWQATWRNWCRNAKPPHGTAIQTVTVPSRQGIDPTLARIIADRLHTKPPSAEIRAQLDKLRGAA